ncbi:aspartyl-phosphate phosphatase Spo0E family protein [Halalkalibacillus sediminis]|uniref:aspartyl-phosphate phosphatase Spo0E family protein n=1 Tax=Halalkalibacillus sediminis TaxID=2018042 RepID=UPI001EE428C7|nr:aspartyl-phosphate phosphatase Spo0E family protein [Halalkalibacillus sediminis]
MTPKNKETLQQQIEAVRKQMILIATEKGYTSQESVEVSQKLDDLLNEYQSIRREEESMLF